MARSVLVVPCFNEARRLSAERFLSFVDSDANVDFVLVDDGSTDGSAEVLAGLAARAPERFAVLSLDENRGKAEAVRRGMLEAFSRDPDYAGYWDADLSTPLEEIDAFRQILDAQPRIELVLGSRVRLLGREIARSAWRHYPGRVFATAASQTLGLPVYDTQCGAKLLRCSDAMRALFETPFLVGWTFDVEVLARLMESFRRAGGPAPEQVLYEYPLRHWSDAGESKVRSTDLLRALWELARIHRFYRPRRVAAGEPRGGRAATLRDPNHRGDLS